jgi:16S rRNA processing protein RimM
VSAPEAIARIHKPHGTKGELAVWALVENPGRRFEPGTVVRVASEAGQELAGPLTIVRRRMYHREWLLTFAGINARGPLEEWRRAFLVPDA